MGRYADTQIRRKETDTEVNRPHPWEKVDIQLNPQTTKEEFDKAARDLLPSESVHLHNEFFLAILTRCQLFISPRAESHRTEEQRTETVVTQVHQREHIPHPLQATPIAERKQAKSKKRAKPCRPSHDVNFEPVYLHDIAPAASLKEPQAIMEAGPDYHSRSLCLLDMGPLKGRLLLAAWDHGLTQVGDQVAMVVQVAVQHCLKNILTLVISRRRGYRVREGRFIHSVGTTPANPWLRNSTGVSDWASESLGLPLGENSDGGDRPVWPTVDASDQNAAHLAACGPVGLQQDQPLLPPVSCFDLFHTLQVHRSVIPVHSVYGPCMERISSRLWHPGWGEVEQDAIVVQETLLKDTLREHRLAANTVT